VTKFLNRQSFRRKLLLAMLLTSGVALLLAAATFTTYEWFVFRENARRDVQAQAQILAANLSAAVSFGHVSGARRVLEGLRARPQFDLACVFSEDRLLLAGYTNSPLRRAVVWPDPVPAEVIARDDSLCIFQPVTHDNQTVGTLFLSSAFNPIGERFRQYLLLAGGTLLACWLIAFWMAARLQRVIAGPILDLARTTRQVTEHKDYSLRAVAQTRDEVGDLIDGFNEMLSQIQSRDTALRHAHDKLEQRVADRTSELLREVVERRRIEAALADEKERLAVTLRSIGDAVVATDPAGRVIIFNPVAEKLSGTDFADAIGRPLSEILHFRRETTGEPCEDPVAQILLRRGPVELSENITLDSRDGAQRLIASSGAPIRDRGGSVIGVVLVFRDVTEKHRTTQELLRASKLESVGLLAGGIAHDFNNILTVILGNISMARVFAPADNSLTTTLAAAEKAAIRATDLTRQLLTFSKGGAPVKKTASLGEIIHETASFVLHGSNVRAQIVIPPDLWPVDVDVGQISQVINNLAINASHAMPEGGTLRIRATNVTFDSPSGGALKAGRYVCISVQDHGTGIPPENLPRIFDPYFTTKKHGSGLGLASSYSIIRKHDGDIRVESEPGRGTVFHIYLPAAEGPVTKAPEPVSAPPAVGRGRVLVMDDEEPIRQLITRMLEPLGYSVTTTADGVEALRKYEDARVKGDPFSAVILDLTVPGGMGGKETIQRLRALDPAVRAIVSSGYSEDPVMARYREFGFCSVVAKPYRLHELSMALREATASTGQVKDSVPSAA
jgi:PAS domain S-box-containing protein